MTKPKTAPQPELFTPASPEATNPAPEAAPKRPKPRKKKPKKAAEDAPQAPKLAERDDILPLGAAPETPSPAPQLPDKPVIQRVPASTFQNKRCWRITATLEDLREACGQDVELVTLDANSDEARGRVHVMVVEPIHQQRYHREPGDLLCRIHRADTKRFRELLPAPEDAEADCEYCLRKPPRIERRRHEGELAAAQAVAVKPKKKKKKTSKKARKIKKEKAHV